MAIRQSDHRKPKEGDVADKASQLVLTALTKAAADAAGVPLHGNKTTPGLFPTTTLGKQTAQRCCEEGYLRSLPPNEPAPETSRSRAAPAPLCTITDKGLTWLLNQVSPRQVLEDFVRVLESREAQVVQLVALARQMQANLESLRSAVSAVLDQITHAPLPRTADNLKELFHDFRADKADKPASPGSDPAPTLIGALERWSAAGASEDCPLPELFRQVRSTDASLAIGHFHDLLRRLHDTGRIYLHPWTGPLYDIPEPPYALLTGHEVAYYASLRKEEG
jgi:hypothetical protein